LLTLILEPDRQLETYYAFDELQYGPSYSRFGNLQDNLSSPLGLRGGGDDDDDDDDDYVVDEDEDDDDDDDDWVPSQGIRAKRSSNLLKGQTASDWKHVQIPLYGYQGKVWFRGDAFTTFVDAVDRLLGLGNRAGVTYTLRIRDKTKQADPWKKTTISCRGVGNFSADHALWEWVAELVGGSSTPLSGWILFVSGPSDPPPAHWEPTDEHRVLKLSLEWEHVPEANRGDVAYLRMPEPATASNMVYSNQYAPWMTQVCRVLAAGRIPQRPGQPAIPNAFIGLKGTSTEEPSDATYGGLVFLPQLWDKIVESWKANPKKTVVLEASGSPGLSDRFFLFLPGDSRQYHPDVHIPHASLDENWIGASAAYKMLSFVKAPMSKTIQSKLDEINVYLPGDELVSSIQGTPDLVIPVSAAARARKSLEEAENEVAERLLQWGKWLGPKKAFFPAQNGLQMFPQFISLRPVFSENKIRDESTRSTVDWEPSSCSLKQFRAAVEQLCTGKKTKSGGATWYITIQQGIDPLGYRDHMDVGKPSFLIKPQMGEEEWSYIRNCIVEPEVAVSISKTPDKPGK